MRIDCPVLASVPGPIQQFDDLPWFADTPSIACNMTEACATVLNGGTDEYQGVSSVDVSVDLESYLRWNGVAEARLELAIRHAN